MTLYFWNSYIKRCIVVLSCSSDLLVISLPEPGGFTGSLQAVPQSTGQQMVPKIYTNKTIYSQTSLKWPSEGTVKYGHIIQVVA